MSDFWLSPMIPTEQDAIDIPGWRTKLRTALFDSRLHASDLTGKSLYAAQMHEGIWTRAEAPSSIKWSWMLHSSINCFLLNESEHIPQPPIRTYCYWLSIGWYTKRVVDEWLNSLPFKVAPPRPWRGTHGRMVVATIAQHYQTTSIWRDRFFDPRVQKEIDCEG